MYGRLDGLTAACDDVAEYGRRAGLPVSAAGWQSTGRCMGTTSVPEFLAWLDELGPDELRHVPVRAGRASGLAMAGRIDEAREAISSLVAELHDRGDASTLGRIEASDGMVVSELAGDLAAAAAFGEAGCASLEQQGDRSVLSSYSPALGRILCRLDRLDEAEAAARKGRELGAEEDALTQMLWRQAQALVAARRGDTEAAVDLAEEAVAIALGTDMLNHQGDAYFDLGEVLSLAGDAAGAAEAYQHALDCYERKGNVVSARRTRDKLTQLETPRA